MLGSFGGPELLLIFVLALIIFGPRKLPEIGKSLGKMIGEFRRASNELKRTIEDEVETDRLRELTNLAPTEAPAAPSAPPTAPDPGPLPLLEPSVAITPELPPSASKLD